MYSKCNSMAYFWIVNISLPIIPNVWLGYTEKCSFMLFSKHYRGNGQPRAVQRTFEILTPFLFHNAITAVMSGFFLSQVLFIVPLSDKQQWELKTDAALWWTPSIKQVKAFEIWNAWQRKCVKIYSFQTWLHFMVKGIRNSFSKE